MRNDILGKKVRTRTEDSANGSFLMTRNMARTQKEDVPLFKKVMINLFGVA